MLLPSQDFYGLVACGRLVFLHLSIVFFPSGLDGDAQQVATKTAAEFDTISEMLHNVVTYMPRALETLVVHFPNNCFLENSLWDRIHCGTLDVLLSDHVALDHVEFRFQLQSDTRANATPSRAEDELRLLRSRFPRSASRKSLTISSKCVHYLLCLLMIPSSTNATYSPGRSSRMGSQAAATDVRSRSDVIVPRTAVTCQR